MIRVCFVCLGNICRSPTALGVMRSLVRDAGLDRALELDSAGTGGWHAGEPPDRRAQAAARGRGVALESRARQFIRRDFDRFDYVIAMDRENHAELVKLAASAAERDKIHLLRAFEAGGGELDVPDPYYGGERGFADVFDICDRACRGLLDHLRAAHALESS